ncbi:MAG: hypothetical protein ABIG61_14240 [Planctomycetota bacterium]
MIHKLLVTLFCLAAVLALTGCKKGSPDQAKPEQAQEKKTEQTEKPLETKTLTDFQAEAEREIDKSNMATELDKIEKEIETEDVNQEPDILPEQ